MHVSSVTPLPAVSLINPASITYAVATIALIAVTVIGIVSTRRNASPRQKKVNRLAVAVSYVLLPVMFAAGIATAGTVTSDRLHANAAYIKAEYGVTLDAADAAPNAFDPAQGRDVAGKKHTYILKYEYGGIVLYTADFHRVPQATR